MHRSAAIPGGARPSASRNFEEATRHSARVRWFRRTIPIGAGLTVAAIAFYVVVEPFRNAPAGISVSSVNLTGTKVTMDLPKLTGFKKDLTPYEVTAASAAQDVRNPTVVELKEMRANLGLDAKGAAVLEATTGLYDTKDETLELRGDVRVKSDSGYDARLRSARVEFKPGTVRSTEPVHVDMKGGTVDADGLDIVESGKRILFTGNVRTLLQPDPDASPERRDPAGGGLGLFAGGSRAPMHIASGRLEVFDKEGRAVYSEAVVASQGETTMRATRMIVHFQRSSGGDAAASTAGAAAPGGAAAAGGTQGSQVSRIEAEGPVTITSKDQVAVGDAGTFDKAAGRVVLTGHVSLTEGANVTRGDRLVYDTATGVAAVEGGTAGGRVSSVFAPGQQEGGAASRSVVENGPAALRPATAPARPATRGTPR